MNYAEQSTWVSSLIKETFYNSVEQTLQVTFKNGQTYVYEGVEEAEYNSFRESDSKGSYFSKNFRSKKFSKIEAVSNDTANTQN